MFRYRFFAWNCLWVSALTWCLVPTGVSAQSSSTTAQAEQPAVLVIQLPANAELQLLGEKTTLTGTSRRFKTPPLSVGRDYDYPIQATWKEDGQLRTVERTLKVRGGVETRANLLRPEGWPTYQWELAGNQQLTVRNPNARRVVVAVRSQNGGGRDFTVGASQNTWISIPPGRYDIYFQFSTDPEGLYQGDSFSMASNQSGELTLGPVVNGNFGIRRKNPGWGSPFAVPEITPSPAPVPEFRL